MAITVYYVQPTPPYATRLYYYYYNYYKAEDYLDLSPVISKKRGTQNFEPQTSNWNTLPAVPREQR